MKALFKKEGLLTNQARDIYFVAKEGSFKIEGSFQKEGFFLKEGSFQNKGWITN